jgi:glycosyltransferase involved in cell wall biosynthesis
MRVTFVISSLGGGGMERVACTMANHWVAVGWSTTVLTFDDGTTRPFYELDPRVRHVPLGIARTSTSLLSGLRNNVRRLGVLRSAIRESGPDVVLGFMDTTNVLALIAARGLGVPVVASEHQDPFLHRTGRAWDALRRLTYRWADRVAINSESFRAYFPRPVQRRVAVLPSPIVLDGWRGDPPELRWPRPVALAIGRLTVQKGLDILLQAFERLRARFPEWTLVVLGEGPLRRELEALRERLGLAGCVQFPGTVPNPRAALAQADLFVMPSRWESFPMALCEALASGLPVVTTEYHPGVHDIVRVGIDALVVPPEDAAALAAAMERLMADPVERRRLGARAVEVTDRYGLERVMQRWSALLEDAARQKLG